MPLPVLTHDCSRCAALCCVAHAFDASSDFAFSKPAGTPCPNLARDLRCRIHPDLVARGMSGCAQYDCHGAGQRVMPLLRGGIDGDGLEVFRVMRTLHTWLAMLAALKALPASAPQLLATDLRPLQRRVDALLKQLRLLSA